MSTQADILLLAGPTAAGKTALSLQAARTLNADIINADSMQVYDGLQILSARPIQAEMEDITHHLFGEIDPSIRFSVGEWTTRVLDILNDLTSSGRGAVLVGGTGLYFKALTEGLAPIPDIPDNIRDEIEQLARLDGIEAMQDMAEEFDPDGVARLKPGDRQRLQRIAEVGRATGQALSVLQAETRPMLKPGRWHGVVIKPDRQALYDRIEQRYEIMIKEGGLDEARRIAAMDIDPNLPAMKAVGLPPLLDHLAGKLSLDEAISLSKRDTRRYAKRQYTWFGNQTPDWDRITSLDPDVAKAELATILSRVF